jgi:thiol-disulfide isomerase/thioredoxin/uncharacterized membrane protein YphA (DoxX/SURF4 family)
MIDGVILAARLLLALTFVVAGAAKLADRPGAAQALEDFGAPARLSSFLAIALPVLELALGLGLLSVRTAWPSAIGACALLLVFTGAIAIALARGRTPECHCFGQLHSAPAGPATLIRNGVLAAIAGGLAWAARDNPGSSLLGVLAGLEAWRGLVPALILVLVLTAAVQSVLLYQVIRQQGRLLLQLEAQDGRAPQPRAAAREIAPPQPRPTIGVPIGGQAPAFELDTLDGGSASLDQLRATYGALLLIFTNPKCGPCSALTPEIAHWGMDESLPAKIVLISEGDAKDNVLKFGAQSDPMVLLQKKRETADAYRAAGTPTAVLIGRDGRMASWVAFGADAIRELVADTPSLLHSLAEAPAQAILPEANRKPAAAHLALQDRDGAALPIGDFRGAPTLLLFWNTACGFCQKMEPDIAAWIAKPPEGAPRVVVVVSGSDAQSAGLLNGATTLIDVDGRVGSAFGARGTPMGVLLDAQTRVASEVAAGAQAVFALLRTATRELI